MSDESRNPNPAEGPEPEPDDEEPDPETTGPDGGSPGRPEAGSAGRPDGAVERESGDADPAAAGEAPGVELPEGVSSEELPDAVRRRLGELRELRDKHLRLAAEFDNYRKRTRRELAEQRKKAQAELARELLDVLDDFTRITESSEEDGPGEGETEARWEGVRMVERKLRRVLEGAGLSRVEAEGERFDPRIHEALTTTPTDDPERDGVVSQVLVEGYRFGDQLLRPARVEVQKLREESGADASPDD